MNITPSITQIEFLGLNVKVTGATNPSNVGIKGKIIDETKNMFIISHDDTKKTVAKEQAIFHFYLPNGAVVEINGALLSRRPEARLKKPIRRLW